MRQLQIEKVDARRYEVQLDGMKVELNQIRVPGSNEIVEGKLIVTANAIGLLEKGMKVTEIEKRFSREFYHLYLSDGAIYVAESEEEAEEMKNPQAEEAEVVEETTSNRGKIIARTNAEGTAKKRLTKEDKLAWENKFQREDQTAAFEALKTKKEKAIYLFEKNYPVSIVAYVLDIRFQQARSYAVSYYGANLKDL